MFHGLNCEVLARNLFKDVMDVDWNKRQVSEDPGFVLIARVEPE